MTAIAPVLALLIAGAGPAPWTAAPFTADTAEVLKAAAALEPPKGNDVDVLLEEGVYTFDAQGRCTFAYRLVYRALTREAAARWAEVARAWAPWHQARPELEARIISPDGSVHRLDPATAVEAGLGDEQDKVYGDRRLLKAPLPAADAGVVVEERATVRDAAPLFEAGTVRRFFVGQEGPVREVHLRIQAPKDLPLRWALRGGLEGTPLEVVAAGQRAISWTWSDVRPRGRREPFTPPERSVPPQVAISTGASWKAVATAYAAVVERQLAGADLGDLVQAMPRGASREKAAQAALDLVSSRVRYTGLELGEAALVPVPPGETLRRRFGDCKDLALLVVGLLRQAGHPATLALVRAGTDDPADLPGVGEFDHAIVALAGEPPIFLDATDPATPAGELPVLLQGRLALVASPKTTALTRLPEPAPGRTRLDVSREITLPENGWSEAREVRELTGWLAAEERGRRRGVAAGDQAARDQERVRSLLVDAVKGTLATEGLDGAGPVRLTFAGAGSHWGITRGDDAEAVVSPRLLLEWLPKQVWPRDPRKDAKAAPKPPADDEDEDDEDGEAASDARREPLLLPVAYQGTLRYRVVPPPGFEPELPLPEGRSSTLGPLTVKSRLAVEAGGVVAVVHELTLSRRKLAPDEVEALREGLAPLLEDQPRLRFVRTSNRLLEAGRGREALDEIRRLVALHPKEARHWNHLALALVQLGLGDAGREAARRAVALEPQLGWAHRVQANTLAHDPLGRWLQPGCDLAGAVAAQRRAAELDREPGTRGQLAFFLEHGEDCVHFGEGAQLAEAAAVYRFIRVELKSKEFDGPYLAALLRAGQFLEAAPIAKDLPDGPEKRAAQLAIRAATEGLEPAVRDALRLPAGDRGTAVDAAGQHLVLARRYPEAAGLLEQASGGTPLSAQLKARAASLARVRKAETLKLQPGEPSTLLPRLFRALSDGGDTWKQVPEWRDVADPRQVGDRAAAERAFRRGLRSVTGLPSKVALDLGASLLETRTEGDPQVALRLVGVIPTAAAPITFAVVKEKAGWRIVTEEPVAAGLGREARRAVERGDAAAARVLLSLARREAAAGPGRPGAVLASLLPEGRDAGPEALGLAAAALESFAAPDGVRTRLEQARTAATEAPVRVAITWALVAGHLRAGRPAEVVPLAEALLVDEPASEPAFMILCAALLDLGREADLDRAAARRQAALPDDPAPLHALLSAAIRAGDAARSVALGRKLAASGKATAADHNNLAWAMLFSEPVDPAALDEARRAVELARDRDAPALHTLATVYAARGDPAEAMQLLRKAVERAGGDDRPASHDWLVVGLVAEQYGLADQAMAAYRRVEPEPGDGLSSRMLAERRLKALGAPPAPTVKPEQADGAPAAPASPEKPGAW